MASLLDTEIARSTCAGSANQTINNSDGLMNDDDAHHKQSHERFSLSDRKKQSKAMNETETIDSS